MFECRCWLRAGILAVTAGIPLVATAAETLYVHGHVYSGSAAIGWAQALAVDGSHITAVGSDAQILKRRRTAVHLVDLRGKTVIPGIVDSHMHLLYGAYALHGLNLSTPAASITPRQPLELVARLQAYAKSHPDDSVLLARADFDTAPPLTPSSALLDSAVADRPLVVHNTSEHALWLNSAAMKLSGVTRVPLSDPEAERGVVRDASGNPTGVLLEAAMQMTARAVAARLPTTDKLSMVRNAAHFLNSLGITSVVNATGDLAEIELYAALRDRGELTVRTRTSFGAVAVAHRLTPQFLADLELARSRYHDDWVAANLVKFFIDGSTGLVPPLVYDAADYESLVMELDQRGYQIMSHALRADSVHMVLDTYERLERAHGARDRRLRIEHADVIDAADLSRFAGLKVIADMQPTFCCGPEASPSDLEQIPTDRWHSLREAGTILAFSSDWPCTWPPNPFVAMQETVTRQAWRSKDTADITGEALDGAAQAGARPTGDTYIAAERIGIEDAVEAYTRGSAYAAFADDRVGTLEPGKLADLAVLSQDIFTVDPNSISQTQVLMTMVGGKVVYQASQGAPGN